MTEYETASGIDSRNHYRKHCCISHEFLNAATRNPSKVAVIHASGDLRNTGEQPGGFPPVYDGDRCFTFADLSAAVDSLSSRLRAILDGEADQNSKEPLLRGNNNYGKGGEHSMPLTTNQEQPFQSEAYVPKMIGIYMQPSVEYIIGVLSVLKCGEAFLPLDPSWPKSRILSVISASNVDLVIGCKSSFSSGCEPLDGSHWLVESSDCPVLFFSMGEKYGETRHPSFVWPCQKEKQREFCYLIYTSGSTGKPKGVRGTEQGLLNRFLWMQEAYAVSGKELFMFKTSISFIDHLQEFLGAVLTASTLVIPPFTLLKENLFSLISFLQAYLISRLTAVPSMIRAILPALQSDDNRRIVNSLKLLILSGEVLPLKLWDMLRDLFPNTSVLNLYGSTEVSGDCTFFDCKRLPKILEMESLSSVPIGMPISNCGVGLVGDGEKLDEGEIYVSGTCVSEGYLHESIIESSNYIKLHKNAICDQLGSDYESQMYHRTGDFGRRLPSGDLVFLGRKDRLIKRNGHRIALQEIENTLQEHPCVADAAVTYGRGLGVLDFLDGFIVLKHTAQSSQHFTYKIRNWLTEKLPPAMIPSHFFLVESLPRSSSGKVDYDLLPSVVCPRNNVQRLFQMTETKDILEVIKKGFCDALAVEKVLDDDDFFAIGGNSIAAAHVCHSLGIDMRLLYKFPSPFKLWIAVAERGLHKENISTIRNDERSSEADKRVAVTTYTPLSHVSNMSAICDMKEDHYICPKRLKVDMEKHVCPVPKDGCIWSSLTLPVSCSFSRCNKVYYGTQNEKKDVCQVTWSVELPKNKMVPLQELWKVHMESCVDASPLLVSKDSDVYLFIGSHSRKFLCIEVISGSVLWEVYLEGRVESSAAIIGDFSQVVVGCYKGRIYFLDFLNGNICWTFQTCSEVKCQPVVDSTRQLIWCGSHDHSVYALDYINHCCVYKVDCGGSIFGSPAIDEERRIVYVASTSGRLTATSTKAFPFHTLWLLELEVPIFGSLAVSVTNGYVICCCVDGHVVALSPGGAIMWRYRTDGPVFAGACMSYALPSQVLVCSREGSVYSLGLENGHLMWKFNVGCPITASAYIDENMLPTLDPPSADRLICVCSSSGTIHLLRVKSDLTRSSNEAEEDVQELATLKLQGDIFSSPVMVGGRIFVGCRDDYVHCFSLGGYFHGHSFNVRSF